MVGAGRRTKGRVHGTNREEASPEERAGSGGNERDEGERDGAERTCIIALSRARKGGMVAARSESGLTQLLHFRANESKFHRPPQDLLLLHLHPQQPQVLAATRE